GPPSAGGAPRDEGPAAADRAGDPATGRPCREGPGDPERVRTGPEGSGVVRPERRGGPDLAPAGPGRPDEGRLPRGADVRTERGGGGAASRGPDSGGAPPTRDPEAAVGHPRGLPMPTRHVPGRWRGPMRRVRQLVPVAGSP